MRTGMMIVLLAVASVALAVARPDDTSTDTGKEGSNQHFVHKASASGLAEVNLSNLAIRRATDPAVKKFATQMIKDHTQANKELLELANARRFKAAASMDAEHKKLMDKLAKATGTEFDRAYMAGQVK